MSRNEPTYNPDLRKSAILLDVDGTIVDIASSPEAVRVPASLRDALSRLIAATDGAVGLVSGRMIADLDHLFAPLRLAMVGGHGAELRLRDGGKTRLSAVPRLDDELRRQLRALARDGVAAEDKEVSVALHYRRAPSLRPGRAAAASQHPAQAGSACARHTDHPNARSSRASR